MRVAEVAALHPDAEGEVVKSGHLHVVLQKLKCRAKGRRKLEVRRTWSPLRKKKVAHENNCDVKSGLLWLINLVA
jgi:hypothetical protein